MKSRYIFKKQATTIVSSGRRVRDYLMYLKGVGQVNLSIPNGFTEAKFFAPLYQTARYMKYEKDGSEREYEIDFPCRSEERRVGKECRSRCSPYH